MSSLRTIAAAATATIAAGILSLTISPPSHAYASNTYPYGQCTYYAKSVRSDIGNHWGDARFWDNQARALGYSVGTRPLVGDVVVFERYVQGNSPYGHVGIVTAVAGSRFKTVSMWGNEATGKLHVAWHTVGGGVSFIHRKTAVASTAAQKAAAAKKAAAAAAAKKATAAAAAKKAAAAAAAKKAAVKKAAVVTKAPAKTTVAKKATPAKTATATKSGK
jgi:surface antigen